MLGKKISPILEEIEGAIIEFDVQMAVPPRYTDEGFRAATKIFMSALMDKTWDLQNDERMPIEDRENMATKAGEDLRKFVKTYTGIDTYDLYK